MQQQEKSIKHILDNMKIPALNEMQEAALAATQQHDNTIILSATGSGKTLAFLLPVVQLIDTTIKKQTQALVIVPSRELAQQIEEVFRSMGTGLKITCCYGGHKRETEENNLVEAPALIVGTPGRLADHIRRGNITVDSISTLVLDEFDKSLELGFEEEVEFIISSLKNIKKRILTSATFAEAIPAFIGMANPKIVNFLSDEEVDESLAIKIVQSEDRDKLQTLFQLLCYLGARPSIIFCNHREAVERTSKYLTEQGILNVFYHGAMEQQERDSALCKFRNGSSSFLVTTDLAARGLDIANIRYIIHYHLPHTEDIFTHRNGRTARMDKTGTAILILSPDEKTPAYIDPASESIELPEKLDIPEKPKWLTLFIAAGKKDKVNKVDIVGFLTQKGELKKEDIGIIEVKDFFSFVAIRKSRATHTLHVIKDQKIKNKKVKIEIAK
jgi:Superfamily II DNA and RNA helicases